MVLRLAPHLQGVAPRPTALSLGRRLLILDVNHVLCERHPSHGVRPSEHELARHAHAELRPGGLVWERPYALQFVEWCMGRFAVALWSSGTRRNVEPIVHHVLPRRLRQHLVFVWCQDECTLDAGRLVAAHGGQSKPLIMKELARVWRRWPAWDAASTLLLDDDPLKCERNPAHTAIHPAKWTHALGSPREAAGAEIAPGGVLPTYLAALHAAPDMPAYVASHAYVAPGAAADADASALSDAD